MRAPGVWRREFSSTKDIDMDQTEEILSLKTRVAKLEALIGATADAPKARPVPIAADRRPEYSRDWRPTLPAIRRHLSRKRVCRAHGCRTQPTVFDRDGRLAAARAEGRNIAGAEP